MNNEHLLTERAICRLVNASKVRDGSDGWYALDYREIRTLLQAQHEKTLALCDDIRAREMQILADAVQMSRRGYPREHLLQCRTYAGW